jgi:hypothetical protein
MAIILFYIPHKTELNKRDSEISGFHSGACKNCRPLVRYIMQCDTKV